MTRMAPALLVAPTIATVVLLSMQITASALNFQIERQSVTSSGAELHGPNLTPAVSGDGRFVAFASDAPDVLPGNSATRDVFLRDRQTGAIELISVATHGGEPDGVSLFPDISANGRYVVFESFAGDIVDDDNQGFTDIFVRDRGAGTTRRVTLTPEGGDLDNDSLTPSISATGRYVTYTSLASTAVAVDTNEVRDVFFVDLETNVTELISIATDGTQGDLGSGGLGAGEGHVTGDGRYVVYGSFASTLAPNDNNSKDDIFVRDRVAGTTERVSVASDGAEGDDHSTYGVISEDGRFVAYYSTAGTLVPDDDNELADIFLRDRQTNQTKRISGGTGLDEANGASRFPDISSDGRYVVFQSAASNLVPNDLNESFDIFRYDTQTGETERLNLPAAGGEAHGASTSAKVNEDGSVVAFQSVADDLIPVDGNFASDVFAWAKSGVPLPTVTASTGPTITPTATPQGRVGDANGNGTVDSIDAALILQHTAGLLPSLPPLADANVDGEIDSIDAALVLQFTAGLLTSLPP